MTIDDFISAMQQHGIVCYRGASGYYRTIDKKPSRHRCCPITALVRCTLPGRLWRRENNSTAYHAGQRRLKLSPTDAYFLIDAADGRPGEFAEALRSRLLQEGVFSNGRPQP